MSMVLAIDPSIRAMGWAVFEVGRGGFTLREKGVLKQKGNKDYEGEKWEKEWVDRVDECISFVLQKLKVGSSAAVRAGEYAGWEVVIEMPDTYSGGKGEVAGAGGAVMKLAFLVGGIRGAIMGQGGGGGDVILAPVRVWKGTTPKELTLRRVSRMLGMDEQIVGSWGHDCVDAIGIGRWYLEKVKGLRYVWGVL